MKINVFGILFIILLISIVSADITQEEALDEIEDGELIMESLIQEGFSVNAINDSLNQAKWLFNRVEENATGFYYEDILEYIEEIETREDQAYDLLDRIRALELKIEEYEVIGVDINESRNLLQEINDAFGNERYNEAEEFLDETNFILETARGEVTALRVLAKSGKSFFVKNWYKLIILIGVIGIIFTIGWRKIRKKIIKNKIKKLKAEEVSLVNLIKKIQKARYQDKTLPASVYNIRLERYSERITEIKHTLPVLEKALKKKVKKKKIKKKRRKVRKKARRRKIHKKVTKNRKKVKNKKVKKKVIKKKVKKKKRVKRKVKKKVIKKKK
jgi:hypothetical protein